ncbi:MAG: hypothetical protein WCZ89_07755 [Phycisphaerae bacterium]
MTRRKFLEAVVRIGSAAAVMGTVSLRWIAEKTSPKRFIRAAQMNRYPGKIKQAESINQQGKWSG